MRKRPKVHKLAVNALRKGEMRYETAYDAPEAARIATRWARAGWKVEIQNWRSLGTKRHVYMTCEPAARKGKTIALCSIKPSFKKEIRGGR